jgi:hypothetical protein
MPIVPDAPWAMDFQFDRTIDGRHVKMLNSPKRRFGAIEMMPAEGLPAQVSYRVLGVADSGYYAWLIRSPSPRAICHAWLTDIIREAHAASRQPTAPGVSMPS